MFACGYRQEEAKSGRRGDYGLQKRHKETAFLEGLVELLS